ncbi:hypothetical protein PsYK624_135930 [Phanerochaete sordida]|uniref:Fungal-type protein kinase domain-containing protein n=1 Tax=Phanerochaete sordida TaxID=48140 RepID=A0A9P3LKL8_9APHY|nr:hypothetical protein PsYK624_135930 [Phanerochaete sordida]
MYKSNHHQSEHAMSATGKIHRRIIFETVGATIMEVKSLSRAFWFLTEVTRELHLWHIAGRVHNNISIENIVILNGHAKLGDMDYAKHDEDERHDVCMDTTAFVAAEVHRGYYILLGCKYGPVIIPSPPSSPQPYKELDVTDLMATMSAMATDEEPEAAFQPNPLHDLESLLWVALFLVFETVLGVDRAPDVTDKQWDGYERAQHLLAAALFGFRDFDGTRSLIITSSAAFGYMLKDLHPRVAEICRQLDVALVALGNAYLIAEGWPRRLSFEDILSQKFAHPWIPGERVSLHKRFAVVFVRLSKLLLAGDQDIMFSTS